MPPSGAARDWAEFFVLNSAILQTVLAMASTQTQALASCVSKGWANAGRKVCYPMIQDLFEAATGYAPGDLDAKEYWAEMKEWATEKWGGIPFLRPGTTRRELAPSVSLQWLTAALEVKLTQVLQRTVVACGTPCWALPDCLLILQDEALVNKRLFGPGTRSLQIQAKLAHHPGGGKNEKPYLNFGKKTVGQVFGGHYKQCHLLFMTRHLVSSADALTSTYYLVSPSQLQTVLVGLKQVCKEQRGEHKDGKRQHLTPPPEDLLKSRKLKLWQLEDAGVPPLSFTELADRLADDMHDEADLPLVVKGLCQANLKSTEIQGRGIVQLQSIATKFQLDLEWSKELTASFYVLLAGGGIILATTETIIEGKQTSKEERGSCALGWAVWMELSKINNKTVYVPYHRLAAPAIAFLAKVELDDGTPCTKLLLLPTEIAYQMQLVGDVNRRGRMQLSVNINPESGTLLFRKKVQKSSPDYNYLRRRIACFEVPVSADPHRVRRYVEDCMQQRVRLVYNPVTGRRSLVGTLVREADVVPNGWYRKDETGPEPSGLQWIAPYRE